MKKHLFLSTLTAVFLFSTSLQAQSIKIDAYTKCWVALISQQEAKAAGQFGWWQAWQNKKKAGEYFKTPYTFKKIIPGTYTIVVFNPTAQTNGNGGDGVVLEKVIVSKKFKLNAYYAKEDFKEWYCLSCPWLYVHNGKCFVKETEILKDVVGKKNKTTTRFEIAHEAIQNGLLKIKVQEEKDEITHLDQLHIKINGKIYLPQEKVAGMLATNDGQYKKLKKGESIALTFKLPTSLKTTDKVVLESTGFYIPDGQFLEAVYQKYLISDK